MSSAPSAHQGGVSDNFIRAGKATKLVPSDQRQMAVERDPKLMSVLTQAQAAQSAMRNALHMPVKQLAKAEGQCQHRFMRLLCPIWHRISYQPSSRVGTR
jgi:hypothetical protein